MTRNFVTKTQLTEHSNAVMQGFMAIKQEFANTKKRLSDTERQFEQLNGTLEELRLKIRRQQNQVWLLIGMMTGTIIWIITLLMIILASK